MKNIAKLILLLSPIFFLPAHAAFASWSCDTNCYKATRACKKYWGKKLCVPDPTGGIRYQACLAQKGADRARRAATRKTKMFHGNYCGLGNNGENLTPQNEFSLPAIDKLDSACKEHDMCYEKIGPAMCICDRPLAARATGIAAKYVISNTGLAEKATFVSIVFGSNPCL